MLQHTALCCAAASCCAEGCSGTISAERLLTRKGVGVAGINQQNEVSGGGWVVRDKRCGVHGGVPTGNERMPASESSSRARAADTPRRRVALA